MKARLNQQDLLARLEQAACLLKQARDKQDKRKWWSDPQQPGEHERATDLTERKPKGKP